MNIGQELQVSIFKSFIKKLLIISIYIFQHHWSLLVLFLLAFSQIVVNNFISDSFDFRPYLIIYAGLVGPAHVLYKLYILVKRKKIETNYEKFFSNNSSVTSKDYFF